MISDQVARRIGWSASLACLAVLMILDRAFDSSTAVLTGLYSLAPLIACAVLPAAATALVTPAAVLAAGTAPWWDDSGETTQQYVRLLAVCLIGSTAVAIAAVRVRREERYTELAQIAEAAQRAILPRLPAAAGGMAITARYESAVSGALVGGDLFDCYYTADTTRLLIGDVRGKGIQGVEQAARVIRAFRQAAARQATLLEVAEDMDDYLVPFFGEEEFVTVLLVESREPGRVSMVSAGHPPALVLRRDGTLDTVEVAQALPLGTGLSAGFTASELAWEPGDRLLLYTDGLSEARDAHGDFLDLSDVRGPLAQASGADALDAILDVVRAHARGGRLGDDLALVLLEHQPVPAGLAGAR